MSIKLYMSGSMSRIANGKYMIEVNGNTVGECLNHLVSLFPRIKGVLYYETGEKLSLKSRVQVLVNGESADAKGLSKEVKDGDEIRIKIKMQ